jgi:predicted dehydrogenase
MTTSPHRLRVLVAGAGGFGKEHLGRLAGRPDVKIAGVADANPARLAAVRAGFGVAECLTDSLRLIDSVEADAIIIATPAVSHVEIAVRALGRTSLSCWRNRSRHQRAPPSRCSTPRAAPRGS